MGVRSTFKTFSPLGRGLIIGSLMVGSTVLVAASLIDIESPTWWRDIPYLTGIIGNLTGFLIGAPVALVALQTLISDKDAAVQIDAANRVTRRTWDRFHEEITEVADLARVFQYRIENGPHGKLGATPLLDCYSAALQAIASYQLVKINPVAIDGFEYYKQHIYAMRANLRTAIFDYRIEIDQANQHGQLQRSWWNAVSAWSILNTYVRPRRAEFGLPWLNSDVDAIFVEYMTKPTSPVTELFESWQQFASATEKLFYLLPDFKQRTMKFNKEELDSFIELHSITLSPEFLKQLEQQIYTACSFLARLKQCTETVASRNWPQDYWLVENRLLNRVHVDKSDLS